MSSNDPRASPATSQAYRALAQHIREERFHPGERIGTERLLAEKLGVGRAILRQAVDLFEAEGQIRRVLGRNGGLIFHDGRVQRHINTIQSVPDMVRQQGMLASTRVLRLELARPYADERRALRLEADDPVVVVRRLRLVDGTPWSLDQSVLPAPRFPGLMNRDLTQSLYGHLVADYGVTLEHADETIETVAADDEQAEILQIPVGDTLLSVRRIAYDSDAKPIEFAHDLFRSDRTRVHMQKIASNWKRSVRRERDTPV